MTRRIELLSSNCIILNVDKWNLLMLSPKQIDFHVPKFNNEANNCAVHLQIDAICSYEKICDHTYTYIGSMGTYQSNRIHKLLCFTIMHICIIWKWTHNGFNMIFVFVIWSINEYGLLNLLILDSNSICWWQLEFFGSLTAIEVHSCCPCIQGEPKNNN